RPYRINYKYRTIPFIYGLFGILPLPPQKPNIDKHRIYRFLARLLPLNAFRRAMFLIPKRGKKKMKRYITTFLMAIMLAVMVPVFANTTNAQTRYYVNSRGRVVRVVKGPSFYQRHRNILNIAMGAGAGALVGGLIGGRRGVGYGLLAGG